VIDRASFDHPTEISSGIDAVYVNGQLACEAGVSRNTHAGVVLG
jgi:N-acyl-D-amino-acid deacylase